MADLEGATVRTLAVNNQGGVIEAGVVRTLSVTQPDACPASLDDERSNVVRVQSVSSGVMIRNDKEQPVGTIRQDCGIVFIGSDEEFHETYED